MNAERLLRPDNLGLRMFLAMGRGMPGVPDSSDQTDAALLTAMIDELSEMDEDERQGILGCIAAMERATIEIIREHGGVVPEAPHG